MQPRRTDYVFKSFPQHQVLGLLNFSPRPETSSLLDFLFPDPLGKTAVIIVIVIVIVGTLGQQQYQHFFEIGPKITLFLLFPFSLASRLSLH